MVCVSNLRELERAGWHRSGYPTLAQLRLLTAQRDPQHSLDVAAHLLQGMDCCNDKSFRQPPEFCPMGYGTFGTIL